MWAGTVMLYQHFCLVCDEKLGILPTIYGLVTFKIGDAGLSFAFWDYFFWRIDFANWYFIALFQISGTRETYNYNLSKLLTTWLGLRHHEAVLIFNQTFYDLHSGIFKNYMYWTKQKKSDIHNPLGKLQSSIVYDYDFRAIITVPCL